MTLAIRFGLVLYIEGKLIQDQSLAQGDMGNSLLQDVLRQFDLPQQDFLVLKDVGDDLPTLNVDYRTRIKFSTLILRVILQHGADPNHRGLHSCTFNPWKLTSSYVSPWEYVLQCALTASERNSDKSLTIFTEGTKASALASIIRLFIQHGANPNSSATRGSHRRSALAIVEDLFDTSRMRGDQASLMSVESTSDELRSLLKSYGAVKDPMALCKTPSRTIKAPVSVANDIGDQVQSQTQARPTVRTRRPSQLKSWWTKTFP